MTDAERLAALRAVRETGLAPDDVRQRLIDEGLISRPSCGMDPHEPFSLTRDGRRVLLRLSGLPENETP